MFGEQQTCTDTSTDHQLCSPENIMGVMKIIQSK